MSTRTIIEINHDFLPQAMADLQQLIERLPNTGTKDLKTFARDTNSIRVCTQRHSADKAEVLVNGFNHWTG